MLTLDLIMNDSRQSTSSSNVVQHPYNGSVTRMRLGCKQWLQDNYAQISHLVPNITTENGKGIVRGRGAHLRNLTMATNTHSSPSQPYFFHKRAVIGIACAQATALRTHMAPDTAGRLPFPPSSALHDPLLFPAHPPHRA